MKNLNTKLFGVAAALVVGILASMTASAAGPSDTFTMTVNVDPVCFIDTIGSDVNRSWDTSVQSYGGPAGQSSVGVTCNADLPYELEVDTNAGGEVILTDTASSKTLQGFLSKSDGSEAAWGSVANGEAIAGIGTGLRQAVVFNYAFPQASIPAVGVYNRELTVQVNF